MWLESVSGGTARWPLPYRTILLLTVSGVASHLPHTTCSLPYSMLKLLALRPSLIIVAFTHPSDVPRKDLLMHTCQHSSSIPLSLSTRFVPHCFATRNGTQNSVLSPLRGRTAGDIVLPYAFQLPFLIDTRAVSEAAICASLALLLNKSLRMRQNVFKNVVPIRFSKKILPTSTWNCF